MSINIKSVYDRPSRDDGFRILIDPAWPRGIARKEAKCDWMRGLGPSDGLRAWMNRNPRKQESFRTAYLMELGQRDEDLDRVCKLYQERGSITILSAATEDDKWQVPQTLAEYLRVHCGAE